MDTWQSQGLAQCETRQTPYAWTFQVLGAKSSGLGGFWQLHYLFCFLSEEKSDTCITFNVWLPCWF